MNIGILALQGAVTPHESKLRKLGASPIKVRTPHQLESISGLILPGGESTTMVHLLQLGGMWLALREFVSKRPTWGICAGAILMAQKVTSPSQPSLETMEIEIERNAYGRQNESFTGLLSLHPNFGENAQRTESLEAIFIRAPKIRSLSSKVRELAKQGEDVVLAEQDHCLVSTFHPELGESSLFHEYFLNKCKKEKDHE